MNNQLETIKQGLEGTRPTFDQMNLNKLNFAKELEFAMQIFEKNTYLQGTNANSVKNALVNVALSGLTLNPVLKYCYLVPRKGACCVDVSYMGLMKIVTDSGSAKSIRSDVAYEKDVFDVQLGSGGFINHKPFLGTGTRGRKIGAYSIAVLSDGSEHIDFMRWDEIMAIKARSESVKAGKHNPWISDEDEMACKTVVKRHWKYLPKSERAIMAAQAIDLDNQINGIDFDQEGADANQQAAPANQDPNTVTTPVLLASEKDMKALGEAFANPLLKDKVLGGKYDKVKLQADISAAHKDNKLTSEKAAKYIKALNDEIAWYQQNQPVPPAPVTEEAKVVNDIWTAPLTEGMTEALRLSIVASKDVAALYIIHKNNANIHDNVQFNTMLSTRKAEIRKTVAQ